MAPPIAEEHLGVPNGTSTVNGSSQKAFEDITITGFYSRDIRFPVR